MLSKISRSFFKRIINKFKEKEIADEDTLKKMYPLAEDELCLICPWGIGDTLIAAGLAHKIKQTHNIKKIVLLIKPGQSYIGSIFPAVDKIYYINNDLDLVNKITNSFFLKDSKLLPGHYFMAHFENYSLTYLIGYKKINLFDCYKVLFKIDLYSKLEIPVSNKVLGDKYCENIFLKHNLKKGKTILLATEATSIPSFTVDFWIKVCVVLKNRGYDIVLNSKFEIENLKEYATYIDIPLNYIVDFSLLAGKVIAIRSGLCDLLSIHGVDITILYPPIKWYSGRFIEGASVSAMGFSNVAKEFEIEFSDDREVDLFTYLKNL